MAKVTQLFHTMWYQVLVCFLRFNQALLGSDEQQLFLYAFTLNIPICIKCQRSILMGKQGGVFVEFLFYGNLDMGIYEAAN